MHDITLEKIMEELQHRKVGERMLRVCTPMTRCYDDVPSPKGREVEVAGAPVQKKQLPDI